MKRLRKYLRVMKIKKEYVERRSAYIDNRCVPITSYIFVKILVYKEIIKRLFDYCFPIIDKMGAIIDNINKNIFQDKSKSMLGNILRTKKDIINCKMIIKTLRPVIFSLEKIIKEYISEDEEIYFDDITDKIENIWNTLENHKEVIESIDSTLLSLTNQRTSSLMRVLRQFN